MSSAVEFISPDTMPSTLGYSQIVRVRRGELLYFSGQVGMDAAGRLVGTDYPSQLEQIFRNILAGLEAVGATFDNLVKLNFFVSDNVPPEHVAQSVAIRDRFINLEKPPASAFVFVSRLMRPEWLVECEAIGVKEPLNKSA
jgi:enamine deaminase RidA (YjgF/YER057c/UK114 family)